MPYRDLLRFWAAGMILWSPPGTGVRKSTRRRQAAAMPPSPRRPSRNTRWKSWSFHQAYSEAEEAALRRVAVLTLKIFGRAAAAASPAAKLVRRKQSSALILDEMQRCPIETFCALGSRHDTVAAVGDRG